MPAQKAMHYLNLASKAHPGKGKAARAAQLSIAFRMACEDIAVLEKDVQDLEKESLEWNIRAGETTGRMRGQG